MNYKIQDESGDKKYFTIIPNYILNHSTLYDREVYIQMKRIAGENGTCWCSRKTLAKQCGISLDRLKKSIKYLIEHGWIKKTGLKKVKTFGGNQSVSVYKIVDLWQLNNNFYRGVVKNTPLVQRGVVDGSKGGSPNDYKEEPIEEESNFVVEEKKEQIRKLMKELGIKKTIK